MLSPPMRFTVTELSGPDSAARFTPWNAPGALSDSGLIAGGRARRAALWERGRDRYLPIPPGKIGKHRIPERQSEACGVNNNGALVGSDADGAFLWERGGKGKRHDLGDFPKPSDPGETRYVRPIAVNNQNEVVGDSNLYQDMRFPDDQSKAFRWRNGVLAFLPMLGARTVVQDLNEQGVAVGWAYHDHGYPEGGDDGDACVWDGDSVTKLPAPPGATPRVRAHGINNRGEIVGVQEISVTAESRCLLWRNRNVYDLGPGVGNAINDAGVIVGSILAQKMTPRRPLLLTEPSPKDSMEERIKDVQAGRRGVFGVQDPLLARRWDQYDWKRAAVWIKGKPYLLDEMLTGRVRWGLTDAHAINNRNQIVARGFRADTPPERRDDGYLLLTPVRS